MSPILADGFLTTGPTGQSFCCHLDILNNFWTVEPPICLLPWALQIMYSVLTLLLSYCALVLPPSHDLVAPKSVHGLARSSV